jgi:DNA-binding response OmpR family regulator
MDAMETLEAPDTYGCLRLLSSTPPADVVLTKQSYTLGRSRDCDIVIAQPNVSRIHARIERRDLRYYLHDAGSRNGSYVNQERISEPCLLNDFDAIGLGSEQPLLLFLDPNQTSLTSRHLQYRPETQSFTLDNQPVRLPPGPEKLLLYLFKNIGRLCTREDCARAIWGPDYAPGLDAMPLERHVSNLRTALRAAEKQVRERAQLAGRDVAELNAADWIETRKQVGYSLKL